MNPGCVGQTPRRYPIGHAARSISEFFFLVLISILKKLKKLTIEGVEECYLPDVGFEVGRHNAVALFISFFIVEID